MLKITERARDVLHQMKALTGSMEGGLRIARPDDRRDDPSAAFQVAPTARPRHDDTVVEHEGARVFLGRVAAKRVRDRVLDARRDARGRIEFVLRRGGH